MYRRPQTCDECGGYTHYAPPSDEDYGCGCRDDDGADLEPEPVQLRLDEWPFWLAGDQGPLGLEEATA